MDWTQPSPADVATIEACRAWNTAHPDNFYGMRAEAALHMSESDWDSAEPLLERLAALYPEHRAPDSAWSLLASIARARGDEERELQLLEKSAAVLSDDVDVFRRLLEAHAERDQWDQVLATADRLMAVDPLGPVPHEFMARAAEATGNWEAAVDPLGTLTRMDPVDPAGTYFRHARALFETGDTSTARRQVLKCLEQAPRYRDAHQLLLRITESQEQPGSSAPAARGADPPGDLPAPRP
jgi:tetratricopeptide (TPR) repeat protein